MLATAARTFSLAADLTRVQDLSAKLDLEILEHDRLKNDVLAAFGVASLTEALERDEQLRERDDLCTTLTEIEERIAAELSVETFEQAHRLLDAVDFDALLVEKAESEQRLLQLDEARQQQLIRQTRAMDKLNEIGVTAPSLAWTRSVARRCWKLKTEPCVTSN